jgi:uncharacterized membrane-anchored protein YjiN (DUF445 family)
VLARIRQVPAAPIAGRGLELMTADGRHHELVTTSARGIVRFIEENRVELRGRFGRESPWWVPEPIDDRIFEKLFQGLRGFLVEVADDPDHLVRDHLDRRIARLVDDLCHDPEYRARGEALKEELLAHPALGAWTATLWRDLKAGLLSQTADPGSELRRRVAGALDGLAVTLAEDPELQAKVDAWVESAVRWIVESYRGEVSELIAATVARWDPTEASSRVELAVGRDLQFIRINGTIVGGLAGLVIHAVGNLIG